MEEMQYLGFPQNRYRVQVISSVHLNLYVWVYEGESLEKWSEQQFILL